MPVAGVWNIGMPAEALEELRAKPQMECIIESLAQTEFNGGSNVSRLN